MCNKPIFVQIEVWNKPANELSTVLPKECLPQEYGGTMKSVADLNGKWLQRDSYNTILYFLIA